MQRILRIAYRSGSLLAVALLCACDYLRQCVSHKLNQTQRADWLSRWCELALRCMGIALNIEGPVPSRGMVVCNHLGYIDVLVLSAIARSTFVSKSEVRSWPLFGWIATLAGTIYVNRRCSGDTRRVNREMALALHAERPLALFPEGTSSDGSSVLRFHSSLFEAAIATQAPITAAYVSYEVTDGNVARDVCYWGDMTLVTHILRLFAIRQVLANVRFAPSAYTCDDRKLAAAATHAAVVSLSCSPAARQHSSH